MKSTCHRVYLDSGSSPSTADIWQQIEFYCGIHVRRVIWIKFNHRRLILPSPSSQPVNGFSWTVWTRPLNFWHLSPDWIENSPTNNVHRPHTHSEPSDSLQKPSKQLNAPFSPPPPGLWHLTEPEVPLWQREKCKFLLRFLLLSWLQDQLPNAHPHTVLLGPPLPFRGFANFGDNFLPPQDASIPFKVWCTTCTSQVP